MTTERKGQWRGFCNVSRCLAPDPTYFNQSTRAYYCAGCAMEINRANRGDCRELYGNDELCIKVSEFRKEGPGVIRYVVTHVGADGTRTLAHASQGRFTYDTPHPAKQWIIDAQLNNSPDRMAELFGPPLEVRPVECWPGHHDPKGIYFD